MTAPPSGPCAPWTTDELVRACCSGLLPDADLTSAIQFASEILYRLSGRQYPGVCERTLWPPCAGCCANDAWWAFAGSDWTYRIGGGLPSIPYPVEGGWQNCWRCAGDSCGDDCGVDCIALPGPIAEVIEVVIDGEVLDPSAYAVKSFRHLCRIDGGTWPRTNNYSEVNAPGSVGWYIVIGQGREVPPGGVLAASIFACQIAKNQCGASDCVLPQRLKDITREDVHMAFADPLEFMDKGQVGIYEVDLWLHSVNPKKLARRARVLRADAPAPPAKFG